MNRDGTLCKAHSRKIKGVHIMGVQADTDETIKDKHDLVGNQATLDTWISPKTGKIRHRDI